MKLRGNEIFLLFMMKQRDILCLGPKMFFWGVSGKVTVCWTLWTSDRKRYLKVWGLFIVLSKEM